jgi:hypothetical protein
MSGDYGRRWLRSKSAAALLDQPENHALWSGNLRNIGSRAITLRI